MIYKEHIVKLIVNNKEVDLGKDFNIRLNNVINDPTKIGYSQAEYSFSFSLPATKQNNVIFDYANNLSKLNKFHQRYIAELYADGNLIFEGSLTLNSYKDDEYECNLVSVKVYSLDEIFSGMTMNKIEGMEIDFSGVTSMNAINQESNPICTFPLVSYGAFQKDPVSADTVGATYTSKFDLDKYNRWYVESFYPSINMVETLKKAFETKGYTVGGDVFQDPVLRQIYMSTNLADEQVPTYNLGNPAFGNVQIACTSTTWNTLGYQQELQFPYEKVQLRNPDEGEDLYKYNYDSVMIYDLLSSGVTTDQSPSYMYQPNEHIIVIPKSGFYKIELSATTTISSGNLTAALWTRDEYGYTWTHNNETIAKSLSGTCPIEIALVRNYDDNYELIKGKNNIEWLNGKPEDVTLDWTRNPQNKVTWLTCFPHESPVQAKLPTEKNDLTIVNETRMGGLRSSDSSSGGGQRTSNGGTSASGNFSGYRGSTRGGTIDPSGGGRVYSTAKYGYMYEGRETMVYDQAVSPTFICGLSSYQGGVNAVMRNGYSWSKSESRLNEVFAPVSGYSYVYRSSGATPQIVSDPTDYNYNTYINTPFFGTCTADTTNMSGNISCMAWLEKDDILQLFGVTRAYFKLNGEFVSYNPTTSVWLKITAFSDRNYNLIKADNDNRYDAPIEYSDKLNLPNFFNKEKQVKEWIEDITKAFNLEMSQYGNTVQFNTKKTNTNLISSVNLDDRVNSYDIKSQRIDYPKSMAVQYKTDTDEWGFERSAVEKSGGSESILNTNDWYKYGDSGFTKILLNDDTYVTSENNVSTNFSYTWYQDFNHYQTNSAKTEQEETSTTISIPCISKYSYMFDGYDYTESMAHDGYSLTQRFWFKPEVTDLSVWTNTYPPEELFISKPKNVLEGLNLSYKDTENSLLQRYFNPQAYLSSNIINFEAYLSSDEYNLIKNGAVVHVDKDVYIPLEISGYSPTGDDPTELKLMKRVN